MLNVTLYPTLNCCIIFCQYNVLLLWNLILNIILWCIISAKLNIGKKITVRNNGIEPEKIQHVSKLKELMNNGELHCLQ